MMALYKKNGYSMFGACLPTILTLVIFIIAITSFTNYSKYQNKVYFWEMSKAYNNAIYNGITVDDDYIKKDLSTGMLVFNADKIVDTEKTAGATYTVGENDIYTVTITEEEGVKYYAISSGGYTEYKQAYTVTDGIVNTNTKGEYFINPDKLTGETVKGKTVEQFEGETIKEKTKAFIEAKGSEYSAKEFNEQIEKSRFLWVKNIWVTDSPMAHPVESSWENFVKSYGYDQQDEKDDNNNMNGDRYNLLIADLTEEQSAQNGYFILAIITAGISFLMQFVTSKSQKASMELQTVNGQGAQTQKIMMWMMPIMMAFFAFMYTAAFSIYMIISQAISIIFTLVVNWIIDKKFKNAQTGGNQTIRGRVYVPETTAEDKTKKDEKEQPAHDFIKNGKTNHVRGRLK